MAPNTNLGVDLMSEFKSFEFVNLLIQVFEANGTMSLKYDVCNSEELSRYVKAAKDRRDSCLALINYIQANGDELKFEMNLAFNKTAGDYDKPN
jgi:hypothetical protein